MNTSRTCAVVSARLDLGAGRRGVDMGPSAIRIAGLGAALSDIGWRVLDRGSIEAPDAESTDVGRPDARYLPQIAAVCRGLMATVGASMAEGAVPVCLGGDHSVAMGSVAAAAAHHHARGEPIGLVWVDAHTDMNVPETSPSGNVHGMPLAHLLGYGIPELASLAGETPAVEGRHVAVVGVRDVDRAERDLVRRSGVRVITMAEIDRSGMAAAVEEAIRVATTDTAGVWLSFDLDGVDPSVAPGVGTPIPGGLTYREAHLCCEEVARTGRLLGLDMVELNPVVDVSNRTGALAVELVASAMGKTIL